MLTSLVVLSPKSQTLWYSWVVCSIVNIVGVTTCFRKCCVSKLYLTVPSCGSSGPCAPNQLWSLHSYLVVLCILFQRRYTIGISTRSSHSQSNSLMTRLYRMKIIRSYAMKNFSNYLQHICESVEYFSILYYVIVHFLSWIVSLLAECAVCAADTSVRNKFAPREINFVFWEGLLAI